MTETWRLNEHGEINCECSNSTGTFKPCLENGVVVEPTLENGWDDLYKCTNCNKIANVPMNWAG